MRNVHLTLRCPLGGGRSPRAEVLREPVLPAVGAVAGRWRFFVDQAGHAPEHGVVRGLGSILPELVVADHDSSFERVVRAADPGEVDFLDAAVRMVAGHTGVVFGDCPGVDDQPGPRVGVEPVEQQILCPNPTVDADVAAGGQFVERPRVDHDDRVDGLPAVAETIQVVQRTKPADAPPGKGGDGSAGVGLPARSVADVGRAALRGARPCRVGHDRGPRVGNVLSLRIWRVVHRPAPGQPSTTLRFAGGGLVGCVRGAGVAVGDPAGLADGRAFHDVDLVPAPVGARADGFAPCATDQLEAVAVVHVAVPHTVDIAHAGAVAEVNSAVGVVVGVDRLVVQVGTGARGRCHHKSSGGTNYDDRQSGHHALQAHYCSFVLGGDLPGQVYHDGT